MKKQNKIFFEDQGLPSDQENHPKEENNEEEEDDELNEQEDVNEYDPTVQNAIKIAQNAKNQQQPIQNLQEGHHHYTDVKEWVTQLNDKDHSEDQGIEDYKIGGYHPCHIGEVLINRYVLIQKLGWGHFSTVWLAKDFKHGTYAAVKVMKSAPHYLDASYDQVEILQKIAKLANSPEWVKSVCHYKNKRPQQITRDDTHVLNLLNCFLYKGPYGNHFCMVYQILGVNLLQVLKGTQYKGLSLNTVREMTKQVLIGLDFLNRICKIIHTDLKPENVLLCLTDQELKKIVEDGQLASHDVFHERLRYCRKNFGFGNGEESEGEFEQEENDESKSQFSEANTEDTQRLAEIKHRLETEKLNQNTKKSLKKKLKKLQQKLKSQQPKPKKKKQKKQVSEQILSRAVNPKLVFDKIKPLEDGFKIKIADLGNACWTHYHFATQIQTRQYRGPEVILGSKYNTTADLWSLACMTFEMLTGDLLFNPKRDQNELFGKNDDHIAQMMQLLGIFPKKFSKRCSKFRKYFAPNCKLKRMTNLQQWPIRDYMVAKYGYTPFEAERFEAFMTPMLNALPEKRATAQKMLQHHWLKESSTCDKLSTQQFEKIRAEKYSNTQQKRDQIWNYESDREDASVQDNNSEGTEDSDAEWYGKDTKFKRIQNIRLIDQSFTDVGYTGYSEGIDLARLDAISNWQFR